MQLNYDIITVDDDTIEHQIMVRALRKTSYRIKCFESGDEAFEFLVLHQPRHLFVDYRMPGGSGIEFIERLADVINVADINIYLTSGSEVPEAVQTQAHTLGAQFILKDVVCAPGYLTTLCAHDGSTTS